jgi:hypothetical protein
MSTPETSLSHEYLKELRTPEERMELFFDGLAKRAAEFERRTFDDPLDAAMANDTFIDESVKELEQIEKYTTIPFTLSGEKVFIPRHAVQSVEDDKGQPGLAILLPTEGNPAPLQEGESVVGYMQGLFGRVVQEDEGKPASVVIDAIFNLNGTDSNPVTLSNTNMVLMNVMVHKRALVGVSGGAQIKSTELETVRRTEEFKARISESGLTRSVLIRQLHNLERAFYTEDSVDFTPLNKLDIFRSVGALGGRFSRLGEDKMEVVKESIMRTLGNTRTFQVGYLAPMYMDAEMEVEANASGTIQGVLLPDSRESEIIPSIVLGAGDDAKIIPFDRITTIHF